jgi:uncharacterized membrane protein YidH (DUF202 family)
VSRDAARPGIVDPGGQAERTRLSWNRTGLALAVIAALLIRDDSGSLLARSPALLMLVVSLGCFFYANRRYQAINSAVREGRSLSGQTQIRLFSLVALAPPVIGLIAILF